MPRKLPPKGYIRSKDVQEILKVSSAMIRIYVQQKKIKYLLENKQEYLQKESPKMSKVFLKGKWVLLKVFP